MAGIAHKPKPLDAQTSVPLERVRDGRAAERYALLIRAAKLLTGDGEFLCVVRDASSLGLSVRIFHPLPEEGDMTVEMQNGDRYGVELRWQDDERAGFRFTEDASITRIIECPSEFTKRPVRINLLAPAQIEIFGEAEFAMLHDISQQGAKISCHSHLAIDQRVRLVAHGLRPTFAKVRWRQGGMVGLIFDETFQFAELARSVRLLQGYS